MANKKITSRALVMSIISLILCCAMLVGTTFAWFTDNVTSARNTIQSGNLDVVLEYKNAWKDEWAPVEANTKLFNENALYEPGYTEVVFLRVSNAGSLALKYDLNVNIYDEKTSTNVAGETFSLKDYLEIGYCVMDEYNGDFNYADILMPTMFGTRAAALSNRKDTSTLSANTGLVTQKAPVLPGENTSQVVAIVLNMPESVGNEANHKTGVDAPTIDLGVSLVATQLTHEADSFGTDYDANATLPVLVSDAAELKEVLENGGNVTLGTDIAVKDTQIVIPTGESVTLDLNGHTLSGVATSEAASKLIEVNSGATMTIKNGTISFGATTPDTNWGGDGQPEFPGYANNTINNRGTLIIDGATIENKTAAGGASYAIDNYDGGNLIINSGKIDGYDKVAIRMFCGSTTNNVTINGGEITGKRAVWVQLAGSNAATAPDANLTVNGGTLTGTELAIYSYSYGNSFANTDVVFTGGTFNGDVAFGGGYKGDQENVTVTGGTFNGELGRYLENDGWADIAKP